MRKFLFVFVAVLWIVAGVQLIDSFQDKDESGIVQAFNKTNCMEMKGEIQGNVKLDGTYRTRKEQEKMVKEIAARIGINNNYTLEEKVEKNKEQRVLYLTKSAAQATTTIRFVTVEKWKDESTVNINQYIMIDMVLYDKMECVVIYKNKLDEILEKYDSNPNVFMKFEGVLYGQLKKEEKEQIADGLMDEICADTVYEYDENDLYTVYGYTDYVKEYTEVNGEEINVTVVLTSDEDNNYTKIYLATPFLQEDY